MRRKQHLGRIGLQFERLEDRRLLSLDGWVDISLAEAIDFAAIVRDAAIESHELSSQSPTVDLESLLTDRAIVDEERVYVAVEGTEGRESLLTLLESNAFEQRVASPFEARFQGFLPISALGDIATASQVVSLIPFTNDGLTDSVGSVNNDAEIALRAEDLTAFSALTGNGVRIGVISDGIDNLANSQASGDLPATVTVLNAGTGQEGRAMLELIHDIAPGAQLFFASGIGNQAQDFANAVNLLVNAQVDIIVDDIRGNNAATGVPNESWFMDDVASQAYANAVAAGVRAVSF